MPSSAAVVTAQGYTFHVRSVAGVESCCYVDSLDLAFDLGCVFGKAASKAHVFLSHGHVDHVQAFVAHAARRALWKMKPASYYAPAHLVPHLRQLLASAAAMQEGIAPFAATIVPLAPFDSVRLPNNVVVKAIPTCHRVPSLGFVVYKVRRQLRSELVGMDGKAIAALMRQGEEVTVERLSPEIAYTGDTTAEVFRASVRASESESAERGESALRDLVRVKVLITEATYVDDMKSAEDAVARGHMHLNQLVELEEALAQVQTLLLVHFSARYSRESLEEAVASRVPASLRSKIALGM